MSFERYVDYALDVPMYFVHRNGKYIDALGQSFRDFMKGKLPALPGELPYLSDWADHLTTIFPEVRLKQFLEMRGADGGAWNRICALPAFWVGLLYDHNSLDAAWDICKNWTVAQRAELRLSASKDGLNGGADNISFRDLAKKIITISYAGLKARKKVNTVTGAKDETRFLDIISESIKTGITPADTLSLKYGSKGNQNLNKIFEELSY